MTTIYVVTSGAYSDYSIHAVFSTKELAEEYVAFGTQHDQFSYTGADIEEWELDQGSEQARSGLACYQVYFTDLLRGDIGFLNDWGVVTKPMREEVIDRPDGTRSYVVWLLAKDEESARKIANERRIQHILNLENAL